MEAALGLSDSLPRCDPGVDPIGTARGREEEAPPFVGEDMVELFVVWKDGSALLDSDLFPILDVSVTSCDTTCISP